MGRIVGVNDTGEAIFIRAQKPGDALGHMLGRDVAFDIQVPDNELKELCAQLLFLGATYECIEPLTSAEQSKLSTLVNESTRSWDFETVNAGLAYIGGFYEFASTDDDFSPAVNFGHVNRAVGAHLLIVTGAVTVDEVQITVSGTSITDNAVRTPADSQAITIPAGTPANTYFETPKKWNGQVAIETTAGTAITCNYGYAKYHDNNNQDFTVFGLEAHWYSESTDAAGAVDLALLHHKATGWTFNAAAAPTPPTAIARRSTDLGVENGHQNGFPGAWKRSNLDTEIAGAGSEGVIVEVVSGGAGVGNQSFRQLDFELSLTLTPVV